MSIEELFGDLPDGWTYQTLGEVCAKGGGGVQTGPFGSQLHAADYVPVGTPSIMPQNIGDNRISADGIARITPNDAERLSKYRVKRGDIVYSRRGDVERRALVRQSEDGWLCGTGCLRVRLGDGPVDPVFAALYLGTAEAREWIVRHAHGATMPNLNTSILSACPIIVPPLGEQRAIAATLGALDDKIELNRKMNATLDAMARALFRDWFVDFGPTRAKMEGRAPYLTPDLWSLFPDRLDDKGKPEGWEMGTLNDLASLNPESWTARNAPAQVSYVDLANTKWGSIDKVEVYDWADAPSRARRILRAGDTIVGTVRPGNGSFCYVGEDGLTGSTGFAVLRPLHPRDRAFVWCAATSAENIDRLAHLADGGAYPAVRPDAVAATEVVIPGSGVLEAFRAAVSANLDLMEANKAESLTLAQTRDLLLPRLMSGELRVAEAERLAEEVA